MACKAKSQRMELNALEKKLKDIEDTLHQHAIFDDAERQIVLIKKRYHTNNGI